MTQKNC